MIPGLKRQALASVRSRRRPFWGWACLCSHTTLKIRLRLVWLTIEPLGEDVMKFPIFERVTMPRLDEFRSALAEYPARADQDRTPEDWLDNMLGENISGLLALHRGYAAHLEAEIKSGEEDGLFFRDWVWLLAARLYGERSITEAHEGGKRPLEDRPTRSPSIAAAISPHLTKLEHAYAPSEIRGFPRTTR